MSLIVSMLLKKLIKALPKNKENISDKVINDVIELIESCEIARYTPASTDDMDKDYEKAVQILTNFENV